MNAISLFDAKNRLSALIDQVEEGQEVTITRRGKPVARLVPVRAKAEQAANLIERSRGLRQSIANRGEILGWDELKAYRDDGRQ